MNVYVLGLPVSQNYSDAATTCVREYFLNRHLSPNLIKQIKLIFFILSVVSEKDGSPMV